MQDPKIILKELQKLIALKEIEFDEIGQIKDDFKYEPIRYLLQSLQIGAKPEDATSKLLHSIFIEIKTKEDIFAEVKLISGGFADYRIIDDKVNPTQIELKPLFKRTKTKLTIATLKYQNHKDQVQKYLKDNEYIILTNLDTALLFNRDAILDYEPFLEIKFTELITQYLSTDNLWDTVRRLDDNIIKPELENQFFLDLKKWYYLLDTVTFELKDGLQKEELIVLFLNKIIFIKTLEDYGLIPYKYLEDRYFRKVKDWDTKGVKAIFDNFFYELEDWFYAFYDTELFTIKVWDYIKKDVMTLDNETEPHLEHFQPIFEKIMGFGTWEYTYGKGMIHYNYRKIDEDIFGKAYETFIAESRKDSGIFYTPKDITLYMVEETVQELFEPFIIKIIDAIKKEDFAKAKKLFIEMQKIKITDPSSGSGSFLIKALREIYSYYLKLDEPTKWVESFKKEGMFSNIPKIVTETQEFRKFTHFNYEKNKRILLAQIILNHIFALDIDERAIETAKTNLWKEAIKIEPSIYNYHKLPKSANHILPNLQMNFLTADALYDIPIEKQIEIIEEEHKKEIIKLHSIRNKYIASHNNPELLEPIKKLKLKIRHRLIDEIANFKLDTEGFENLKSEGVPDDILEQLNSIENKEFKNKYGFTDAINLLLKKENNPIYQKLFIKYAKRLNILAKPTFIVSEFFFNYFDKKGKTLPKSERGFDAIITNPPWEASKPIKKEYAKIDKFDMDVLEFDKWFAQKIKQDTEFKTNWEKYQKHYTAYNKIMRQIYVNQGVGDTNFYKLFVERDLQLIKQKGLLSMLIPSGIQTDKGCSKLRKLIIKENTLNKLYSFENRGYYEGKNIEETKIKLFPDVDSRFKFSIVNVKKEKFEKPNYDFKTKFYLQHPKELYDKNQIIVNAKMIENFSANNFSIMEFRNQVDYELCSKIRGKHKLLSDTNFKLRTEFHMTNDSHLYSKIENKKKTANKLYLYEGKMIHQYNANYNSAKYFVNKKKAVSQLITTEKSRARRETGIENGKIDNFFENKNYLLDYQTYRLVHRAIGRSTDERTFISTITPKNVFIGNSMNHISNLSYELKDDKIMQKQLKKEDLLLLQSLFNSLVLNYYLRNKVSANLNMFYIYELPIPKVSKKLKQILVEKSFQLLYANSPKGQFEELSEEINVKARKIDGIAERAEIEIVIAKELFGLSKKEWRYLTSTFTYGKSDSKKELDEIISISLEKY